MKLLPLVKKLKIVDKNGLLVDFEPNWAQLELIEEVERQIEAGVPVRIIVLKARQIGISTVIEALMFVLTFLIDRMRGLVVAHDQDSAQHLLSMTQNYWDTYVFNKLYTTKYKSRNELAWEETKSSLKVATARNSRSGRSRTIHFLHASEVGFYDDASTLMTGLRQSIPSSNALTFIFLESTANGIGNYFYEEWIKAEDGETEYSALFFPWWRHPEYLASEVGVPIELGELDDEENQLRNNLGISDDRLAWRRWAIKNLCQGDLHQFHQEYPASPEEAFISAGVNVFPLPHLRACYQPMKGRKGRLNREGDQVKFQADIDGPLTVFKPPSEDLDWGIYFVGGDPTRTTRGDFACIQVINRRTYEEVAVWRGRIDPTTFASEIAKLGRYYNMSMVTTEIEGPGYATIGALMEMDYPYIYQGHWADKTPGKTADNYGWSTTYKRKEWAIGWLLKLVVDHDIIIHDHRTFQEMRDYVTLDGGGYGPAARDGFDDTVMALAITCICASTEGPLRAYGDSGVPMQDEATPVEAPWEHWGEEGVA